MTFDSRNDVECADSRQNFMHGYIERLAELRPDWPIEQCWKLAVDAAQSMFPLPLSPEEQEILKHLETTS